MVPAHHLVWTAYGWWLPNDPRGSMSNSIASDVIAQLGERNFDHPVWGGCGWKVFLDSEADIRRTIRYVEENPTKARMPAQKWDFVTAYDGWPFRRTK